MGNFGKLIDDVRKEIKWINVFFEEIPYGEIVIITVPNSNKQYTIDTSKIGCGFEFDATMYYKD